MSRIVAGVAGGLRLANVPGDNTRPTTDRVKEALFSRLETYDILDGSRVLDLFGGSGALGCEAASRGATHVDFADTYAKAIGVIERNIASLGKACDTTTFRVHKMSARSFLSGYTGQPWDLVFMDPPYAVSNEELHELFELLSPHLTDGAVLVVERSSRDETPNLPETLELFAKKTYGETALYYLEPAPVDE